MKNLIKTAFIGALGLVSLASCGGGNANSQGSASKEMIPESSSTYESKGAATTITDCYIDGLNKTYDLNKNFEFKGGASIDDIEFTPWDSEAASKIITFSGHQVTSVGYGQTTLVPNEKQGSNIFNAQLKSIHVKVIRSSNVVNTFASSHNGTSKMSLEAKNDGTFTFIQGEGTVYQGSESVNVKAANLQGKYVLSESGSFLFTPTDSNYCAFKAELVYDQVDGSVYHLSCYTPLNSKDINPYAIDFVIAK